MLSQVARGARDTIWSLIKPQGGSFSPRLRDCFRGLLLHYGIGMGFMAGYRRNDRALCFGAFTQTRIRNIRMFFCGSSFCISHFRNRHCLDSGTAPRYDCCDHENLAAKCNPEFHPKVNP